MDIDIDYWKDHITSINLKKQRFRSYYRIRPEFAEHLQSNSLLNAYLDDVTRDLIIQMESHIYARTDTKTVSYPRTWWDHVKRDLLPQWLSLRLKPCKYRRLTVTAAQMFPTIHRDISDTFTTILHYKES